MKTLKSIVLLKVSSPSLNLLFLEGFRIVAKIGKRDIHFASHFRVLLSPLFTNSSSKMNVTKLNVLSVANIYD